MAGTTDIDSESEKAVKTTHYLYNAFLFEDGRAKVAIDPGALQSGEQSIFQERVRKTGVTVRYPR